MREALEERAWAQRRSLSATAEILLREALGVAAADELVTPGKPATLDLARLARTRIGP